MRFTFSLLILLATLVTLDACSDREKRSATLFTSLPSDSTNVNFVNKLSFDQDFNIYTYRNFYNGGGVGLGDINNDGLLDVYLIANQGPNKLYLNKGNFVFEDITDRAGVGGSKAWSTGVSFADVNGDGWLDIYVCNSGDVKGDDKENELFINNKDLTFSEQGEAYGVADKGFTTHAVFFDYDHDNDLDLYILNNSFQAIGSFNLRKNERPKRDPLGGDKLLRNDNGKFTDVSDQAGIYGSVIGFGLGVTVGDVNKDGWSDIYVSNDFFERDYLYINRKDGTFKECLTEQIKSISGASMGADMADINNDTWPDIFVTEMLPGTNERIKTVTTFESWDRYQNSVSNDYYHQYTRNMLQLNNGNNTFSEIGRLSGVEATDWSWSALIFDMDNDGLKDIFVANGIYQDLTNQDYLQYVSNEEVVRSIISKNKVDYQKLVELIPSTPVPDYAFHNQGNLNFKNKAEAWGLGEPNFSNGAAYGDLDNDGDLDLVINKVNTQASIIRNETNRQLKNSYLRFQLKGIGANQFAIGTRIEVRAGDTTYHVEQMPNRGFESSTDPRPHLGLGKVDVVDEIKVFWPDGRQTVLTKVQTNQTVLLNQADASSPQADELTVNKTIPLLQPIAKSTIQHKHEESDFVDFDRDKLVYHMISTEGPRLAVGDVDGNGTDDFYIGGSKGSAGKLYVQKTSGQFESTNESLFLKDIISEDTDALFLDVDNDRDLDLFVCSGSNELPTTSSALSSRLYFNDGKGNFSKSDQLLPAGTYESASTVKAADYDRDGDLDLFVGIRALPFAYGLPTSGYILNNDGKGRFSNVSSTISPELKNIGLITDASWSDIDGDKDVDLVIVGEYMAIKVFTNDNGKFSDQTVRAGLDKTNGWWNRIAASDLDNDGDIDFVVANHGLNSRFRGSLQKPVTMVINDFDKNGTVEQIVCAYNGDKSYPFALRHDLIAQIPSVKKKYLKYDSYKDQTIDQIFSPEELAGATRLEAYEMASGIIINDGLGNFTFTRLPVEAQLSTMYAILVEDFDGDGAKDILMGGNLYGTKPEVGRYDASYGVMLRGNGKGEFTTLDPKISGVLIHGEIRDFEIIEVLKQKLLMVSRNNDTVLAYKLSRE